MDERIDEELVTAYINGENLALEILVRRHIKPIFGFVFRYVGNVGDAEDITQDIFVSIWKNIDKFDTSKKFKTWIFAIAKNASLNWLRKKKPSTFSDVTKEGDEQQFDETIEDENPLPAELFDRASLKEELESAIGKLNPRYQTALILHYKEELTFREIAEIENESVNTVKSRHLRAINKLRKILGVDAPK